VATDYDAISEEYQQSKLAPWREHVESFVLFDLVGELAGRSVLDLACGEGFHTRSLKRRGAGRVVGIDLSRGMIELAERQETSSPMGIEYVVHDVMTLDLGERFDLVFAAWLLNYASTSEELRAMCETIARHLKPGARFITINNNPDYTGDAGSMRKYSFTRDAAPEVDGAAVEWTFYLPDETFSITNYQLSRAAHEQAFAAAGLHDVRWHEPRVSPAGLADDGPDFWSDLLELRPMIFLECHG